MFKYVIYHLTLSMDTLPVFLYWIVFPIIFFVIEMYMNMYTYHWFGHSVYSIISNIYLYLIFTFK